MISLSLYCVFFILNASSNLEGTCIMYSKSPIKVLACLLDLNIFMSFETCGGLLSFSKRVSKLLTQNVECMWTFHVEYAWTFCRLVISQAVHIAWLFHSHLAGPLCVGVCSGDSSCTRSYCDCLGLFKVPFSSVLSREKKISRIFLLDTVLIYFLLED